MQRLDTTNFMNQDDRNTQNMINQVNKMLKTIVNGTAVLQYVLLKSLTPLQFYSTSGDMREK